MAFMDYERIKKFKERSDLNYVDKNELDTVFLLMMQHMLIIKIQLREPFQIRF